MHLLLRKSQRDDGWYASAITFILDARLDLDPEEQEFFERYQLYTTVIYDSSRRVEHLQSAVEQYQSAEEPMTPLPWVPSVLDLSRAFFEIGVTAWHLTAGVTHEVAAALSLQITLGTLVKGHHLESESLEEILAIASALHQATEYLSAYIGTALTFDGSEELHEF